MSAVVGAPRIPADFRRHMSRTRRNFRRDTQKQKTYPVGVPPVYAFRDKQIKSRIQAFSRWDTRIPAEKRRNARIPAEKRRHLPAGKQCPCTFCFPPLFFRVSLPARSAVPRSADQRKHAYAGDAGVDTKAQRIWTPRPRSNPPKHHPHMSRAYDTHADTESVCIRTQTWGSKEGDT